MNHQQRPEDYCLNIETNWQWTVRYWRVPPKISTFPCRQSSNGHQASCLSEVAPPERQSHSKLPALTRCTCFTQLQDFITEQRPLKCTAQREVPHKLYREVELCHMSQSVDENKRVWKWLLISGLLLFSTSNSIYICVNCLQKTLTNNNSTQSHPAMVMTDISVPWLLTVCIPAGLQHCWHCIKSRAMLR